ncbi:hypothetical protein [Rufibacter latericius]|uniref:Uncharacterized protein n=1 Tax=Rufibacter latericius TaxID=2487040 RepID=A0A3M9MAU7_9BACT|nr:hypothetical protein [Rufibacter latericius]RNI22646.1 hypothetical protein EFB08_21365 [Rufibacter latericius]
MYISLNTQLWNSCFLEFFRRHMIISDFAVEDFHLYLNALLPSLPSDFNLRNGFLGHVYSDPDLSELEATTIDNGFDCAVDQYHRWLGTPEGVATVRKARIGRWLETP